MKLHKTKLPQESNYTTMRHDALLPHSSWIIRQYNNILAFKLTIIFPPTYIIHMSPLLGLLFDITLGNRRVRNVIIKITHICSRHTQDAIRTMMHIIALREEIMMTVASRASVA